VKTAVMNATETIVVIVEIDMTDTGEEGEGMIVLPIVGIVHVRHLLVVTRRIVALPGLLLPRGIMMIEDLQGTSTGGEAMMIVVDLTLILIVVGMMTVAEMTEDAMTRRIATMTGPLDMLTVTLDIAGKRLVSMGMGDGDSGAVLKAALEISFVCRAGRNTDL
jgi:hypothetical protein